MKRDHTFLLLAVSLCALAQTPSTPAKSFTEQFEDINRPSARDGEGFPRGEIRLSRHERRSIVSRNRRSRRLRQRLRRQSGPGRKSEMGRNRSQGLPTKAAAVALLEKTTADANADFESHSRERWTKTVQPWLAVIEHAGEHYGQLVVYYRNNGMVPPESRPKK